MNNVHTSASIYDFHEEAQKIRKRTLKEIKEGLPYLSLDDQFFLLGLMRKANAGEISKKDFSKELRKRMLIW